MNPEAPMDPSETETTPMETTATTTTNAPHSWSYRRFDADQQATVASDAWNYLQEEALPLLTEIGNRSRDFYQAEKNLKLGFAQVFPPAATPNPPTDNSTPSTTTASGPHVLSHARVNHLTKSLNEIANLLLGKLQRLQTDSRDSDQVTFQMTFQELDSMTKQLQMFLGGSRQLASYCQAVVRQASQARQQSARQNEQIREFITTLWADHSEQLRAYPPFWDLGPLDAPLYGMGRAKPQGTGPAGPPTPPTVVPGNDTTHVDLFHTET